MTSYQKLINEIVNKIEEKREMYGSVVVKSFLYRIDSRIVNFSTLIMPLYSADLQTKPQRFDYGEFILQKEIISLDRLLKILRDLPEKGNTNIALGDLMVQFNVTYSGDYYQWDSGVAFLDIGWLFEKYQFNDSPTGLTNQPLVAIDLPLFPDYREAINQFVGINSERYSSIHGIILCLPNYGARINQIDISSNTLRASIEVKAEKLSNIVGKLL